MVAPNSRYAHVGESAILAPDQAEIVYLRRRVLPDPERAQGIVRAGVRPGERADLLAARTLGNVNQFYRLCDANTISDPFELAAEPGTSVYLPSARPTEPG